jgi:hypothetical protein
LDQDGQRTDAHKKLSAYINLDYGSGRIRGIYLQGNEQLKPLFERWFADIGDGSSWPRCAAHSAPIKRRFTGSASPVCRSCRIR